MVLLENHFSSSIHLSMRVKAGKLSGNDRRDQYPFKCITYKFHNNMIFDTTFYNELITFTQEIIRINSPSWQEQAVANVIKNKMQSLDYDSVQVDSMGNIIGMRIGQQPGPTILFDGHMDVVPAPNPEIWDFDPFSAIIDDGKIFGRGATDMKGPLAAVIMSIGRMPSNAFNGILAVSASVGEESYEGGALSTVLEKISPDFVVICEPNDCCLTIGQKGRAGIWIKVDGTSAHSSQPHLGDNAIYKALPIIKRLQAMQLPHDENLGKGVMELIDAISAPYPSQSSLPNKFLMRYDRRLVVGETQESVLSSIFDALQNYQDWKCGFGTIRTTTYTGQVIEGRDFHPAWMLPKSSPWVQLAHMGLADVGVAPIINYAHYCTNGSQSAGINNIPTIIFGPSSIQQAHADNESIEVRALFCGVECYASLARTLTQMA